MVCLRVQNDGKFSDLFPVTNGVKQGCVLASTLVSMIFSAMLTDAFQDVDKGIPIRYCFDGKLFNLTLVLLNPDIPCLCKQCRSRSVGF